MSAPSTLADSPEDCATRLGRALLMAALLSGCGLMAPLWRAGPLALDEHGSYWLVDSELPSSACQRSLDYAAIPPLSAWLEQAFLYAFGRSEFVFRLPSALCYLAAIGVAWLASAHWMDRFTGGLAALLLAWHPDVDEVRIARCYGLLMLLSALLIWCTVLWRRDPRSRYWPLIWAIVAAGCLWTHYVALPLVGMAWLTLFVKPDETNLLSIRLPAVVTGGLLTALLCVPLAPAILRLREWSPFLNYMPEGQPWWRTLGPLWWAGAPAGLLVAGLARSRRQSGPIPWRRVLLPALWTLVPLACLVLLARGDMSSLANPRYRIPYAAAGACLLAVGLRALNPRPLTTALAALVVIGVTWGLSETNPWQLRRLGAPADIEWHNAAHFIQMFGRRGEPVFVQSGLVESYLVPAMYHDPLFLEYVGCRMSRFYLEAHHPRIGLPYFYETPPELNQALKQNMSPDADVPPAFWVAAATDTDLNQASLAGIERLAGSSGFRLDVQRRGPNMTLLRYLPPGEPP